ncbi:MaoC/PaaZ C-terminal domain-containing protein [Cellvibrio japonicus]|uniref:MaoC-like domain protein n=1 Tax=Cellvibrio japonicus (strain Ueda107) TaxID=498211 RepID=B3PLH2_CELJU|nr:MaoC/PaaZ C-terminal domain-containing protein [Cellvibrio japonicus]ACE83682.1 MaoC-like domain protein [Cellvibrio japonicus Ueda107]QEI12962.1 3-hydroxybutyryl-CoA dehydratase [Cellvibrio japonicus]QEI16536.1 3-hydroxybutyryl-CoA dehydratase [Cellvibrio japonicus]QEI20114.1 3-hydroxybutyryl-CoA dehydratase [Cellvibrio japonicus]
MNLLENYTINELSVGQTASYSKTLTERDIVLFAACSGDVNPVHLDKDYAATTPFGEPIGHGMWTGALVSAAIATCLPGPGSVYRSQSIAFKHPVKPGDVVTVTLTVAEIKARIKLVTLACEAHNQDGKLIAKGTAEVIAPSEKLSIKAGELPDIRVG